MTKEAQKPVVKVAVIGLGRAGHFHLQSITDLPQAVKLTWVIDVDKEKAQRIAAERGCNWSDQLDEALKGPDAVDAVVIASATDTHFPYIMQALRADKAVLAEKPISHELHEVEEAVELAKTKNLAFVCGYQRRADRHFRELKRQLDAGAIGNLKLLKTCSRDNPIPPMEYLRTSARNLSWHADPWLWHAWLPQWWSGTRICHSHWAQLPPRNRSDGWCRHLCSDVQICQWSDCNGGHLSKRFLWLWPTPSRRSVSVACWQPRTSWPALSNWAKADGHRMPSAMYSFPQRYVQAANAGCHAALLNTCFI